MYAQRNPRDISEEIGIDIFDIGIYERCGGYEALTLSIIRRADTSRVTGRGSSNFNN